MKTSAKFLSFNQSLAYSRRPAQLFLNSHRDIFLLSFSLSFILAFFLSLSHSKPSDSFR